MFPDLFGIPDSSYILMIVIGVIACFSLLVIYLIKQGYKRNPILNVLIISCIAIVFGLAGGILTQNLYELLSHPTTYHWTWAMTFYGGLIFGAGSFILFKFILFKKEEQVSWRDILIIVPSCIALAHAFGRIGCFLGGCCYGKVTTSPIGLPCSSVDDLNHIPTQLFEAAFLFILSSVLGILAFYKHSKCCFSVYMLLYGVFRFIIEFFRGDDRGGAFLYMSPSQIWSIILIALAVPTYVLLNKFVYKENNEHGNSTI